MAVLSSTLGAEKRKEEGADLADEARLDEEARIEGATLAGDCGFAAGEVTPLSTNSSEARRSKRD